MKINKEIEQALRSLSYIEKQQRVVSAREISEHQKIPFEKLSKILQKLNAGGIIMAQRGRQGGYRIARDLNEINLQELYKILDESYSLVPCLTSGHCQSKPICTILPGMHRFQRELENLLYRFSLADFTGSALKKFEDSAKEAT